MPVRSKRLWLGAQATLLGSVAYTCPPGETAIVKDLVLYNSTGTPIDTVVGINGTAPQNVIHRVTVPNGGTVVLSDRFVVLHPGDTVRLVGVAAGVFVSGFGAELAGVAS